MKRKLIIGLFLFFFLGTTINAEPPNETEDNFSIMENTLLDNGYIYFNPHEYFYVQIFTDCYEKYFQENWFIDNPGIWRVLLDIKDGFIYNLFYPLKIEGVPNILAIVYLQNNGETYGYYKVNYNLDGKLMETIVGEKFVFY
jgi:hypothetical protein